MYNLDIWTRWRKIKGKVYRFISFDKGKTWKQELTPHKQLPYVVSENVHFKNVGGTIRWKKTHFPDEEARWHIQNLLG